MESVLKTKGEHITWIFRAAFSIALLYFGTICYLFYNQATKEAEITQFIRHVYEDASKLEDMTFRYVQSASLIGKVNYNSQMADDPIQLRLWQSAFRQDRNRLTNYAKEGLIALADFKGHWAAHKQEARNLNSNESFADIGAQIKKVDNFFRPEVASGTKNRKDLGLFARNILNQQQAKVLPALNSINRTLDKAMVFQAEQMKLLLANFLIFALGGVLLLAFLVFMPLDFMVRKLLFRMREDHEQIQDAVKRAMLADHAKSEFLANMSHEIRTPMNGVMGMAELLMKTNLDQKQKTFAEVITKSGATLLTIINDILDFSKIDAGELQLEPAPFRLAEAVEDVVFLVSGKVAEKDLDLGVRIDPNLPDCVVGDVGRIRQILTNLIGNAVKFTEAGYILVELKGDVVDGVAKLHFSIKDTGIGISPDKCQQVFGKFSQADISSTRRHEGTGLGLAISASLVNLMDGEIGVDSELGSGSEFWFKVDLEASGDGSIGKRPPIELKNVKVLVVDNHNVSRSIVRENMDEWGFDCAAASTAQEAFAVMDAMAKQNLSLDCIVVDYHLPDSSAQNFCNIIRSSENFSKTPIILLTSVDHNSEGESFAQMQIQSHQIKPVRASVLLHSIVNAIQDSRVDTSEMYSGIAMAKTIGAQIFDADIAQEDNAQPELIVHSSDVTNENVETTEVNNAGLLQEQYIDQPEPVLNADKNAESNSTRINEPDLKIMEIGDEAQNNEPDSEQIDILLAEDNEVNQLVFTQILDVMNRKYRIANNGHEAVEMYKKYSPKVICMDVSMPEMNGLEATKAIRELENESGKHTPIIGVTAHALKGDRDTCIDAGMDDYLSKPVSPKGMEEKIYKWLLTPEDQNIAV